jgi:hypothetical protein
MLRQSYALPLAGLYSAPAAFLGEAKDRRVTFESRSACNQLSIPGE